MRISTIAATLVFCCVGRFGDTQSTPIPPVHGTVLTGQTVDLPAALKGKTGILVLGFSQASRDQVTEWGKRLAGDYRGSETVIYFEMPVLESVPRILRGFVTKKMGESVPDRAKNTFLPVLDHEADWKVATGFKKSDVAYVVVVDGAGVVHGRVSGPASDATFGEVKRLVGELQAK